MIAKKNKKANLERKRFAFFQIGLLVSGSLVLAAFEYSTVTPDEYVQVMEDDIPILDPIPPKDDDNIKIVRPQQKQTLVNPNNVEIKVVKQLSNNKNVGVTNNQDVIFIPGDDCIDCDIDMTITDEGDGEILDIAEIEPEFPGGEAAMLAWIGEEIVYPSLPAEMGIGGIQYIQFVVNTDGSIVNVKTVQSTHEDLAKEGMRVVKKMPKWKPGEQAGKKVRVRYTLPINFVNK